jgi:hypothetical protein
MKCEYPNCDCELECRITGLRLDYYDQYEEPPLRKRTIRERAADVMRPGLGMVVLAWRWVTGGGRR